MSLWIPGPWEDSDEHPPAEEPKEVKQEQPKPRRRTLKPVEAV
jgi:hypothetical protein